MNQVGTLSKVDDLKTVWEHEARDFTTWLANNLELLGEEIGIDLEHRCNEYTVGKFRLDILAHDLTNDRPVAIENQLEVTDHSHLGQLLTYLAQFPKTGIGIWISKRMRDEHIAALEWLNNQSKDGWSFFGVEVKLFKVDNSLPAPYFDIIVKPNDYTKNRTRGDGSAPSQKLLAYQNFWQNLLDTFKSKYPGITNASKGPTQNWCAIPSGYGGLAFQWAFKSMSRFVIELYIDFANDQGHRSEKNEVFFRLISEKREEIEHAMQTKLKWEQLPAAVSCRIELERDGVNIESLPEDLTGYAIDKMALFRSILLEHIKPVMDVMKQELSFSPE
ncbi:DUF4268 domain-containing protein [Desulfatitalea alkaliphila]|uniref:DUF4268 domain-containing protein n=1 Tax=Desulfatitalea alkaliphila TaxID=2929485 RepID=A0AA41R4I5_9BACT|nr:DUF4268 domain-containing protein [Desulfatitalea alkaliphila]MCJ8501363.1 DUF4268 domain-containing protein [Desulfatitalea alkaliphila]